jgi:hypothetical protein
MIWEAFLLYLSRPEISCHTTDLLNGNHQGQLQKT